MLRRTAHRTVLPLLLAVLGGCAAMHAQQIENLRNDGQHARADCYERCDPSDLMCLKECDNAHPKQLSAEQLQMIQQAAQVQAASDAQKQPAEAQPPTVTHSSSSSSAQRTLTINGQTYTGGEHLGKPCGLDDPCPDGYQCHLVTDQSGQCVQ